MREKLSAIGVVIPDQRSLGITPIHVLQHRDSETIEV